MNRKELFKKAQNITSRKVKGLDCSCIIQSGSSLLKEDFSPGSDIDLLAIFDDKVEEKWDHDFSENPQVSIMRESKQDFQENLQEGNPFELMALKFGEIRKDDGFLESLDSSKHAPTEKTSQTWIRSGLNQYSRMLEDINLSIDFYSSAYHSFRSFSRVLILEEEEELFERDENIKKSLAEIDSKASEYFWSLRKNRFNPPDLDYIELEELEEYERFEAVEKVEYLGRKILSRREKDFPAFSKLRKLLKDKGYRIFGSFVVYGDETGEKIHVSGISEDDHKIFEFDLQNGGLKALN